MNKRRDLTIGDPFKEIALFALPMIGINVLMQMYSMVDTIIVGQVVGKEALAAIGDATPILMVLIAIIIGLDMGITIILSQCVGANDKAAVRKSFGNGLYLFVFVSACIMIGGNMLAKPLLVLMGTPEEVLGMALIYLRFEFCFCPAQIFYHLFTGTFRSIGDSKTPLYYQFFSSVLNIVLDIVMVCVFRWGIAGAALATGLAHLAAAVLAGVSLFRKYEDIRLHREDMSLEMGIIKQICTLAIPISLQNCLAGIANTFVMVFINAFGVVTIAGYSAASRISQFATQAVQSVGNASSVYVAQNYGAKKYTRIRTGVKKICLFSFLISALITLVFLLLRNPLLNLLTTEEQVIEVASECMIITVLPTFLLGVSYVLAFSMRGLGHSVLPMVVSVFELLVRVAICYIGAYILKNVTVIWLAWPVSYLISVVLSLPVYLYTEKKSISADKRQKIVQQTLQ